MNLSSYRSTSSSRRRTKNNRSRTRKNSSSRRKSSNKRPSPQSRLVLVPPNVHRCSPRAKTREQANARHPNQGNWPLHLLLLPPAAKSQPPRSVLRLFVFVPRFPHLTQTAGCCSVQRMMNENQKQKNNQQKETTTRGKRANQQHNGEPSTGKIRRTRKRKRKRKRRRARSCGGGTNRRGPSTRRTTLRTAARRRPASEFARLVHLCSPAHERPRRSAQRGAHLPSLATQQQPSRRLLQTPSQRSGGRGGVQWVQENIQT
mmetsp:Transcript_10167/g.31279  ORF Transcript_10167/g.31279 Transcript_10167/m.31279 type:complete len:260 (+) Transcript_10167:655-1434(+)